MSLRSSSAFALIAMLLVAPATVLAEKGGKHGKAKGVVHEQRYSDHADTNVSVEFHFGDRDRDVIEEYYGGRARAGHCPPGLAKKGNGCMPPGQARKWAKGRPLPQDIRYYELPHDLIVRLPPPPEGHRYVRVAGDVLLIAVGSSMVVDAIQDILR